jgi:prepilin-type N-terminal cleavage/methylation domain-containing protein
MRTGVTLVELMVVLAVTGILTALALPRMSGWKDRLAVSRAGTELVSFYQTARLSAIYRSQRVRLELGGDSLRAVFEGATDSVFLRWPGPRQHGVRASVSRPVIWIQPNGLGFGAANTKIVLRRGAAAESLTTSRLGRLRRWP